MNDLNDFLRGGTMVALLGLSLFFLRYWSKTNDRLFGYFSAGFLILSVSQVVVLFLGADTEKLPYGYWIRLSAFICIMIGIISKNLPGKDSKQY